MGFGCDTRYCPVPCLANSSYRFMSGWTLRKQRVAVLATFVGGMVTLNALLVIYAGHAFSKCPSQLHRQQIDTSDTGVEAEVVDVGYVEANILRKKLGSGIYELETSWLADTCLPHVKRKHAENSSSSSTLVMSIEEIGDYLTQWQNSDNAVCK